MASLSTARASGLPEHSPNAGGTDGHHIGLQHHERQSSIAFQGMFPVEADDGLLLPRCEPEITGNPTVVLIDAPVAFSPGVELAGPHTQPVDESSSFTVSRKTFSPEPTASGASRILCCNATSAIRSAVSESTAGKFLGTFTVKARFMRSPFVFHFGTSGHI